MRELLYAVAGLAIAIMEFQKTDDHDDLIFEYLVSFIFKHPTIRIHLKWDLV